MAISASAVWEVRTDGSDTNGGGFVTGASGTDYSQQSSAQLTVTDGACSASTTLTSATGGFTAAMIGNLVYLSSGPGWYEIKSYTDTNTVTIDRAGPTATGMTLNVGGALATPGRLSNLPASKNRCWIKSGTYTITTSTPGPSGPYYQSSSINVVVEGYGTTRGDGTRPVMSAGTVSSVVLWRMACTNRPSHFRNLEADANGQSSVDGFKHNAAQLRGCHGCKAVDCAIGFATSDAPNVSCTATGCTTGFGSTIGMFCTAADCTTGFSGRGGSNSTATGCTTGFKAEQFTRGYYVNCTAHDCGTGFLSGTTAQITQIATIGCISHSCTTGFTGGGAETYQQSCATYNCTSSTSGTKEYGDGVSVFTADPCVDAAGGDYTLTAAAHAEKSATDWQGETWVSHIGAVTPLAGGGGLLRVGMSGGING